MYAFVSVGWSPLSFLEHRIVTAYVCVCVWGGKLFIVVIEVVIALRFLIVFIQTHEIHFFFSIVVITIGYETLLSATHPPFHPRMIEEREEKNGVQKWITRGTVSMHAQWQWRICIHIVAAGNSNTVNFTLLLSSMCHLDQQSVHRRVGIVGFGRILHLQSFVVIIAISALSNMDHNYYYYYFVREAKNSTQRKQNKSDWIVFSHFRHTNRSPHERNKTEYEQTTPKDGDRDYLL